MLEDVRKAPVFFFGTDSATTGINGCTKHLDFKVRFFSEKYGILVDIYLDSHWVGHKTAEEQKDFLLHEVN
jgi:hypothetical protein